MHEPLAFSRSFLLASEDAVAWCPVQKEQLVFVSGSLGAEYLSEVEWAFYRSRLTGLQKIVAKRLSTFVCASGARSANVSA